MYLPIIFAGFSDCHVLPFHVTFGLIIISLSILPIYLSKKLADISRAEKLNKIISLVFAAIFSFIIHVIQLFTVPRVGNEFNKSYFGNNLYLIVIVLAFGISFFVSIYFTKRNPNKSLRIARTLLIITTLLFVFVGIGVIVAKTLDCIG